MPEFDVAAQVEIRDLTARFSDAVNRRAPGDLATLFTADGEWHVPGLPPAIGQEAIHDQLATLLQAFAHLIQLTHSGHIDVHGDEATATWYITESGVDPNDKVVAFTGTYIDELVRTDEGWRFQRRTFAFLYRGRPTADARWFDHPAQASALDRPAK